MLRIGKKVVTALAVVLGLGHACAQAASLTILETPPDGYSDARGINNAGTVVGNTHIVQDPDGPPGYKLAWATIWEDGKATLIYEGLTPRYPRPDGSAYAINRCGVVAGGTSASFRSFANIWKHAVLQEMPWVTGDPTSPAFGINDAGQVVGLTRAYPSAPGFVWDGTNVQLINNPFGGRWTSLYGINNAGQIVGSASTANSNETRAVLWNGTTPTALANPLGGTYSSALAINNRGQAVGSASSPDGSVTHAVLWDRGSATDLGTPPGFEDSFATAINELGLVVGKSYTPDGEVRATLWFRRIGVDLNSLLDSQTVASGWVLRDAEGINDRGWIVGNAVNTQTNQWAGYLLKP